MNSSKQQEETDEFLTIARAALNSAHALPENIAQHPVILALTQRAEEEKTRRKEHLETVEKEIDKRKAEMTHSEQANKRHTNFSRPTTSPFNHQQQIYSDSTSPIKRGLGSSSNSIPSHSDIITTTRSSKTTSSKKKKREASMSPFKSSMSSSPPLLYPETNSSYIPSTASTVDSVHLPFFSSQTSSTDSTTPMPEINLLGTHSPSFELVPHKQQGVIEALSSSAGTTFVDITPYLTLPQTEAAIKIGIPPSTLSKRWKEAGTGRKWPWRSVCKIDKEIMTLLHNVKPEEEISPDLGDRLHVLLRQRQQELRPVTIRLK